MCWRTSIDPGRATVQRKRSTADSSICEALRWGSGTWPITSRERYWIPEASDRFYTLFYDEPVYRRVFTSAFIPGASETQMRWFDDLQRLSMTPEAALASSIGRASVDVSTSASAVVVPTLVLHADDDRVVPFEEGRRMAGLIPGARLVCLHGKNHILLADEPAWGQFVKEVTAFAGTTLVKPPIAGVTSRELEVLRLVAQGLSNDECSSQLTISTRTVERHLSNVYAKLSLTGKSARAAVAARLPELERDALDE